LFHFEAFAVGAHAARALLSGRLRDDGIVARGTVAEKHSHRVVRIQQDKHGVEQETQQEEFTDATPLQEEECLTQRMAKDVTLSDLKQNKVWNV